MLSLFLSLHEQRKEIAWQTKERRECCTRRKGNSLASKRKERVLQKQKKGGNAELQRKESGNRPGNKNTAVNHNRNVYHRLRQCKGPITSRNSAIRLNPFLIYFYRCMEATRQLA